MKDMSENIDLIVYGKRKNNTFAQGGKVSQEISSPLFGILVRKATSSVVKACEVPVVLYGQWLVSALTKPWLPRGMLIPWECGPKDQVCRYFRRQEAKCVKSDQDPTHYSVMIPFNTVVHWEWWRASYRSGPLLPCGGSKEGGVTGLQYRLRECDCKLDNCAHTHNGGVKT
ncbi:hypothetical protein IEQ34_023057 [Dendrobium chrysotoxum]|uniref:Uncharacterized protein n=1 Tax=Dendrobium chrysotoxum TaxID=161865 RepID=A0AAV7G0S7_DENCH|nr:hypothetical protein IEQ34_023057 [Dendrobium chrysotoxum]